MEHKQDDHAIAGQHYHAQPFAPHQSASQFLRNPSVPALGSSASLASFASFAPSQSAVSVAPSTLSTGPTSLPRASASCMADRIALDHLSKHHANLRRAVPAVDTWQSDSAAHAVSARNHAVAGRRNKIVAEAQLHRLNQSMVSKITDTVLHVPSPYSRPSPASLAASQPKSLNISRRKAEQVRIAQANLRLAQRIVSKKALVGKRQDWERHAAEAAKTRANISRFIEVPQHQQQHQAMQQQQQQQWAEVQAQHQQIVAHVQHLASTNTLPPGHSAESYFAALVQEMQLAMMQQQQQQQQQQFAPAPPNHARSSASTPSQPHSGLLAPLPDSDRRAAKLNKKLLAAESARFGPRSEGGRGERLLKPLRAQEQEQQYTPSPPSGSPAAHSYPHHSAAPPSSHSPDGALHPSSAPADHPPASDQASTLIISPQPEAVLVLRKANRAAATPPVDKPSAAGENL